MNPRLDSSRRWTDVPRELIDQIQSVFSENFRSHLQDSQVVAAGRIYPGEILIRVGMHKKNQLRQSHWSVSIAYKAPKDNVVKLLNLAVDALGSLFEELFVAESDAEFPRTWQEVQFEGRSLFIMFDTVNEELEEEADRLLGEKKGKKLTGGDWEN